MMRQFQLHKPHLLWVLAATALVTALTVPVLAGAAPTDAAQAADGKADATDVEDICPEQVEGERILLAPPCGAGETSHQCDVQDGCSGRHFRDHVCCPAGTHGDCLVAVNGLGCVQSVDAVCVPDE